MSEPTLREQIIGEFIAKCIIIVVKLSFWGTIFYCALKFAGCVG